MSSDKEQNEDADSGPEENPEKEETPSGATQENSENQDNKYIKLKVIGNDQNGIHFKLKTSTALMKLKKSYSTSVGIPVSALRFLFDGKRISDDDTPKALDMRDDDQIEVYQEQTGGRWLSSISAS